ncbi:hypothetical protein GCM10011399_29800 [Subtercola lobariae]|uniref:HipA N-terminal subdomain 1 domain-containing protein n=2 Tax=Subtercola lobariae TaxID=1588641 RepID=A0A917BD28_9MICO|nr:hypothetical protein GCM10011399_29800 [Subtercola lobariae]
MFSYDADYVSQFRAYSIEPAMPLVAGPQAVGGALPRAFADAAPDRWGRNLIARRFRAERLAEGLPLRQLATPGDGWGTRVR